MDQKKESRDVVEEQYTKRLLELKYKELSFTSLRRIAPAMGITVGNRNFEELAFACAWSEAHATIEKWEADDRALEESIL